MNALQAAIADPSSQAPKPAAPPPPLPEPVEDGEVLVDDHGQAWRWRFAPELERIVWVRVEPRSSLSGAWFDEVDEWALALPTSFPDWEEGVDG